MQSRLAVSTPKIITLTIAVGAHGHRQRLQGDGGTLRHFPATGSRVHLTKIDPQSAAANRALLLQGRLVIAHFTEAETVYPRSSTMINLADHIH
jgi:hypothetical protein